MICALISMGGTVAGVVVGWCLARAQYTEGLRQMYRSAGMRHPSDV